MVARVRFRNSRVQKRTYPNAGDSREARLRPSHLRVALSVFAKIIFDRRQVATRAPADRVVNAGQGR